MIFLFASEKKQFCSQRQDEDDGGALCVLVGVFCVCIFLYFVCIFLCFCGGLQLME